MQSKAPKKLVKKEDKRDRIAAIIMLAPVVFLLLVCSIYPFIWMFRYVCYDYNGFNATFTGTRNFTRMISSSRLRLSARFFSTRRSEAHRFSVLSTSCRR